MFHPVITVFISRCQQGGQDTRVYSLTCQVQKSSLWPIFGDQYLYRSQLFYHVQVQTWLKDEGLGPLELFEKYGEFSRWGGRRGALKIVVNLLGWGGGGEGGSELFEKYGEFSGWLWSSLKKYGEFSGWGGGGCGVL